MSGPRLIHLTSIGQLRAAAGVWDDLWRRSEVTLPAARAELVAQWVEQFAPRADFRALVVEDQGQWVAALPLVHRRLWRVLDAGVLPANEWSGGGELLLDATADMGTALEVLVGALGGLPWQLVWLDQIAIDAPRWLALRSAAARAGVASHCRPHFQVGWIEIDHDWQAMRRRWSAKHRQNMARAARRLGARAAVQLRRGTQLTPEEVEPWLRRGFEVEDRSWKGRARTSVLRTAGMFRFFLRQAQQLAEWGALELALLEADGQPMAFAYGMTAKGVYHSGKIGYDPRYAAYAPGQLLRYRMLEAFQAEPGYRAMDCAGPLSDAHRRWRPARYSVGRLVLAPRRLVGRLAVQVYQRWRPLGVSPVSPSA